MLHGPASLPVCLCTCAYLCPRGSEWKISSLSSSSSLREYANSPPSVNISPIQQCAWPTSSSMPSIPDEFTSIVVMQQPPPTRTMSRPSAKPGPGCTCRAWWARASSAPLNLVPLGIVCVDPKPVHMFTPCPRGMQPLAHLAHVTHLVHEGRKRLRASITPLVNPLVDVRPVAPVLKVLCG